MIEIILCDDHKIVREGIKRLLQGYPDINILADVPDGESLFKVLRKTVPDILILDVSLPGRSGLDILKQVKQFHPSMNVLILSMYPEDQFAIRMIKAGASGYMHKDSPPEQLLEAVHKVSRGEKYLNPAVSNLLFREISGPASGMPHEKLSDREYEVMLMIGKGRTLSEIADILSLSIKTISTYRSRIFQKLGLRSNADLIKYLISQDIATE